MRFRATGDVLELRAVTGTRVVMLTYDILNQTSDYRDCTGFVFQRETVSAGAPGEVGSTVWFGGAARPDERHRRERLLAA